VRKKRHSESGLGNGHLWKKA